MNVLVREKCDNSDTASDMIAGWQAQEFFILGYYSPQDKTVFGIFKTLDGPTAKGQRKVENIVVKLDNMRSQQ